MKLSESDHYSLIIVLPANASEEALLFHEKRGRRFETDCSGNIRVLERRRSAGNFKN